MKISIITASYNSGATVRRTVESVLMQTCRNLEYLLIDGGSKDDTASIVESYRNDFESKDWTLTVISEKDHGIYDAMNKGIRNAGGDVIGILNSDDWYCDADVLECVLSEFEKSDSFDMVYGNLMYMKEGKPYRYWRSGRQRSFRYGWMPPHPSLFVRKNVYDRYGLFRLDCGVNADYELMLRLFEVNRLRASWVDKTFTYMQAGGTSNNGIKSRFDGIVNDNSAWKVNGLKPAPYTILLKKLRKIPQFIIKK